MKIIKYIDEKQIKHVDIIGIQGFSPNDKKYVELETKYTGNYDGFSHILKYDKFPNELAENHIVKIKYNDDNSLNDTIVIEETDKKGSEDIELFTYLKDTPYIDKQVNYYIVQDETLKSDKTKFVSCLYKTDTKTLIMNVWLPNNGNKIFITENSKIINKILEKYSDLEKIIILGNFNSNFMGKQITLGEKRFIVLNIKDNNNSFIYKNAGYIDNVLIWDQNTISKHEIIENNYQGNLCEHHPILVKITYNNNISTNVKENKEKIEIKKDVIDNKQPIAQINKNTDENIYKVDKDDYKNYNVDIEFKPYVPNSDSDISSSLFYDKYQNANYYLTNGANSNINSSGGGTTAAFNAIGKQLKDTTGNLLFNNIKELLKGDEKHIVNAEKKYTFNSVYYVDINKTLHGKTLKRVYHILGINYNDLNLPNDLKNEENNQKYVEKYYISILINFYLDCMETPEKNNVIYLASIPGKLYEGKLTWKGMIRAINKFKDFLKTQIFEYPKMIILLDYSPTGLS